MKRVFGSWVGFIVMSVVALAAIGATAPMAGAATGCSAAYVNGYRIDDFGDPCVGGVMYVSLVSVGDVGMGDRSAQLGSNAFRGWGKTASHPCNGDMPNPCAVNVRPDSTIPAWRWGSGGWSPAKLATGTWAYIQRYSGAYEWAYVNGSWYAIEGRYLDAYCSTTTTWSNCTVAPG